MNTLTDRMTDGERITELEHRLALLEAAVHSLGMGLRALTPASELLARDIRHAQTGGTT